MEYMHVFVGEAFLKLHIDRCNLNIETHLIYLHWPLSEIIIKNYISLCGSEELF